MELCDASHVKLIKSARVRNETVAFSDDWSARSWSKILFQVSVGAMVIVDLVSIFEMSLGKIWIGQWLWVSPSAFSTVFIGTAILVRRRGLSHMDSFLVSLTAMVSMIWMYEIFYHFGFYADWEFAKQTESLAVADYNQPVVIDVLLASVGLVGLKYMRAALPFALAFGAFAVAFVVWVMMGYPQVTSPGALYPFGTIIIHVSDPQSWAYPMNILTKYLLAIAYVSLFVGKPTPPSELA